MIVNNDFMSEEEVKEIIDACNGETLNKDKIPCHIASIEKLRHYFDTSNNKYYDINQPLPGQAGWTVLAFATFAKKPEEVKQILAMGADPNVTINNAITPLQIAASEGYDSICTSLLKRKAAIDAQSAKGRTAMMGACQNGRTKVVKTLIPYGPKPLIKDNDGKTCLDYAQENGHYDIVRIIDYAQLKNEITLNPRPSVTGRKVSKI